jgi:hypothetical protein
MHIIRLRGPWQYEVIEQIAPAAPLAALAGKQQQPADWGEILGADFRGTVRYRRVFHEPTGLEAGQGVWLVVTAVRSHAKVELDGQRLGESCGDEPAEFPIAGRLRPTCELVITVTHDLASDSQPGGLVGEVHLAIQTVRPRPVD